MSLGLFLLGALGGGIGAALRFVIDGAVAQRFGTRFPWGIFVINASGSLLLGFMMGLAESAPDWAFSMVVGLTGGYTTFSTATIDTVRLLRERRYGPALANSLGMLIVTVVLAIAGLALGLAL